MGKQIRKTDSARTLGKPRTKILLHPTTFRWYFVLYRGKTRVGSFGTNYGWPTKEECVAEANAVCRQILSRG